MTEKLVQIQGNGDSVRVSGVVRVIGVRVSGVLLYTTKTDYRKTYIREKAEPQKFIHLSR